MNRRHPSHYLLVAFLAVIGGVTLAQQKGRVPPFSIRFPSVEIVHFAALEAVQKDLGVSDEVARKLTLLREDYRATYQKECQDADILQLPGPLYPSGAALPKLREIGRKLDEEFIPKVNELLSADQQSRFQQIRFQGRLRNLGPKALVDVASELMLTDDQQQKLNALAMERGQAVSQAMLRLPGAAIPNAKESMEKTAKVREEFWAKAVEVLTAEQKATVANLKGSDFDVTQLVVR